ncbi:MAG TPA: sigma-54 dependent transcriptional regulator [Polyangiaceae bacterium]|nr:sigma-54 dependent transcriptional regulator [Polyangiaceae bacterium]
MDFRVLVVDADQELCEEIQSRLERGGWSVSWCTSAEDGVGLALEQPYDAILVELTGGGLSACRRLTQSLSATPVILMAADGDLNAVVSALRAGAYDFVSKPLDLAELRACVERSVRDRYRREAIHRLAQVEAAGSQPIGKLLGDSRPMHQVYDLIRRVGKTETTVLISGESGTGKELVARALHAEGARAQGPFVALNCAAVPANLLESELFGHVRGSFTDALGDRKGLFQEAHQGTLFLDEIGELPLEMQPKLLRVLQERQVRPVGGNSTVNVQARVVAATNRDLEQQVALGRFRSDLYFRLNVVQLCVPPLRARGEDILALANHFLRATAERLGKNSRCLSPEAAKKLLEYDWPGNVRQLENVMERAVTLAQGERLEVDDLPDRVRSHIASFEAGAATTGFLTLDQQEQRHIAYVLRHVGGNKTQAARLLGVDRRTLYRKLLRCGDVALG